MAVFRDISRLFTLKIDMGGIQRGPICFFDASYGAVTSRGVETMLKKLIQAGVAAAVVATPMIATSAEAQPDRRTVTVQRDGDRVVRTVNHRPNGTTVVRKTVVNAPNRNYRRWAKGQRFDRRYARNYTVVSNPRAYRLNNAPRGYHWVRSGNDAVLVGVTTGLIAAVMAGAIR
jgi:Ni/Co efflux regulator RcnB